VVHAFIVYVGPMLEYNSVILSRTHLKCDIERTEKVQRQFTKRLYGFKHSSYKERLTKLGIPSLELRRLYLDLTHCYKIVFGLVTLNMSDFFEFSQFTGTRGHAYKLHKVTACSVRMNFFAN